MTIDLRGVNFDFDKATLRSDAIANLDAAVDILSRYPDMRVEVAAIPTRRTPTRTTRASRSTAQLRANAVYDGLAGCGIDRAPMAGADGYVGSLRRIATADRYGGSHPIAPNTNPDGGDNPEGRARNRRTGLNVQN